MNVSDPCPTPYTGSHQAAAHWARLLFAFAFDVPPTHVFSDPTGVTTRGTLYPIEGVIVHLTSQRRTGLTLILPSSGRANDDVLSGLERRLVQLRDRLLSASSGALIYAPTARAGGLHCATMVASSGAGQIQLEDTIFMYDTPLPWRAPRRTASPPAHIHRPPTHFRGFLRVDRPKSHVGEQIMIFPAQSDRPIAGIFELESGERLRTMTHAADRTLVCTATPYRPTHKRSAPPDTSLRIPMLLDATSGQLTPRRVVHSEPTEAGGPPLNGWAHHWVHNASTIALVVQPTP